MRLLVNVSAQDLKLGRNRKIQSQITATDVPFFYSYRR